MAKLQDLLGISVNEGPCHRPMPRFEFGSIALRGMRFELRSCQWDPFGVTVSVVVPDRDTDVPIDITFRSQWPEPPRSQAHMADMLEAAIAWMVAHEMAERILLAGERRDPHARGTQGPPPRHLRFPLQLVAVGMQPLGSHEPSDVVAVLTRSEVIRAIKEHALSSQLASSWTDRSDEVLRAMLRGLIAKAASTTP